MDSEIQLISDGDGLLVLGDPRAVDRFIAAERLPSRQLDPRRLRPALATAAGVTQTGSEIAANSGRWVQLTEESAQLVKKYGLRESSKSGLSTGVVKGSKGQVKAFLEFAKAPGLLLSNPAMLSGAAGIMAQLALQQAMDEITEYLATIDAKVDDVLRAQKDAVLARMIGVGLVIDESMTIREKRGRVDEVTWSKIQNAPATIAETQAYALRQLDALAEKLEGKSSINDLAKATKDAESRAQEWLAVLARTFQLQDAVTLLELDRVLDASPEELDGHRLGLKAARQDRLELIGRSTKGLIARMNAVAAKANTRVLVNPSQSPAVVTSSNHVLTAVVTLNELLGIEGNRHSLEARRWGHAAIEARDKVIGTGAHGVDTARRVGKEAAERARSMTGKLASGVTERTRRRRRDGDER